MFPNPLRLLILRQNERVNFERFPKQETSFTSLQATNVNSRRLQT